MLAVHPMASSYERERLLNFSEQCFISHNMANNLKETKQAGKLD